MPTMTEIYISDNSYLPEILEKMIIDLRSFHSIDGYDLEIECELVSDPDELPELVPFTNTFKVDLSIPFYHKSYARGNWVILSSILYFFIHRCSEAVVWYGGDCSEEFFMVNDDFLNETWCYWSQRGYRDYYREK